MILIYYLVLTEASFSALETRRSFGLLFIGVAAAVCAGAILGEIASMNRVPIYFQAAIWIGVFAVTFGAIFPKFRKAIPAIKGRMKNSIAWSTPAKAVNGLAWAAPFAAIGLFIHYYQYLILLGIGLGNLATYIMMKRYSRIDNHEQLVVSLIALSSIPVAAAIDYTLFLSRQDIAVMISRLLVAIAYGVGGAYAFLATPNDS
jgi:hypothetical protein